jgi:uncharacterized protein YbgA (DUF1722 family)/uncharacterized protein YbbK (DUF523 family)
MAHDIQLPNRDSSKIIIGTSSCLLGQKVRFDTGHKHDRFITDVLGPFVTLIPVCPEVEIGMGAPRESVKLVGNLNEPRMVGNKSGEDWTDRMLKYARQRVKQEDIRNLTGYILKRKSPSCGMERVRVQTASKTSEYKGVGLFASALLEEYPYLPIEEEGRLNDPALRENFIERIFALSRLQELFASPFSRRKMIEFHTNHKFMLLSHSTVNYRRLGQLVGQIKEVPASRFKKEYRDLFMHTLKFKATVKKNTNVLQHIMGFLKDHLSNSEKRDVNEAISNYHDNLIPLVVPITLLRHFVFKYEIDYIQDQYYLSPHPKELMLRNHV